MNSHGGDVESLLRECKTGCWDQTQVKLQCGDGLKLSWRRSMVSLGGGGREDSDMGSM